MRLKETANGSKFFEWDGVAFNPVPGVPDSSIEPSFAGNMLALPTGQILFTDGSSDVELYTSTGSPCAGCAPNITSVDSTLARSSVNNVIRGTQFNGLSQGGAYGDDAQAATNYPLVRITNVATSHVCFATMHDAAKTHAAFDMPSSTPPAWEQPCEIGASQLQAVVNGIASAAVAVTVE